MPVDEKRGTLDAAFHVPMPAGDTSARSCRSTARTSRPSLHVFLVWNHQAQLLSKLGEAERNVRAHSPHQKCSKIEMLGTHLGEKHGSRGATRR